MNKKKVYPYLNKVWPILSFFFFIPHLILYFFSNSKSEIDEDIIAMERIPGISIKGNQLLLYLLWKDKFCKHSI